MRAFVPSRAIASAICAVAALAAFAVEPAGAACTTTGTAHCLQGRRFEVEIDWLDYVGNGGKARAVPGGTADSGLFWFYGPDNWEVLVKVLNGCHQNDRFWVFAAAATTLQYLITVTDTQTGAVKTYFNPLDVSSPATTDIEAFATCGGQPAPTPTPASSPTPTPAGGLAGLIGTWDFTYTIIIPFTDRYRFQHVETSDGQPLLFGLDDFGGEVAVGRIQDLTPGSTLPYEFVMLDPSAILCKSYVFDRTGPIHVEGLYAQLDVTCSDITSNLYPMVGTRISTASALASPVAPAGRDEVLGALQLAESAAAESGMSSDEAIDADTAAEIGAAARALATRR